MLLFVSYYIKFMDLCFILQVLVSMKGIKKEDFMETCCLRRSLEPFTSWIENSLNIDWLKLKII